MKRNEHINYKQNERIYHKKVADLAIALCPQGGSLCDIGAGVGHTLYLINKVRPDINLTAVDQDGQCIEEVSKKIAKIECKKIKNEDEIIDINNIYNVIIMSHTLEHILKPYDILMSLKKKVKKGGAIILAVPNAHNPYRIIKAFKKTNYINKGHVCIWDRAHWQNFIENITNFKNVQYDVDYIRLPFFHRYKLFWAVEKHLAQIFPGFSTSHIAIVKF